MFCDISPTCYKIALQKEICKRHIKNFLAQENYADTQDTAPLPCIVAQYSSHLIKRGKGIDPVLQENKAVNGIPFVPQKLRNFPAILEHRKIQTNPL